MATEEKKNKKRHICQLCRTSQQMAAELSHLKQAFAIPSIWESGIRTGHGRGSLSLFHNVGGLSWKMRPTEGFNYQTCSAFCWFLFGKGDTKADVISRAGKMVCLFTREWQCLRWACGTGKNGCSVLEKKKKTAIEGFPETGSSKNCWGHRVEARRHKAW